MIVCEVKVGLFVCLFVRSFVCLFVQQVVFFV